MEQFTVTLVHLKKTFTLNEGKKTHHMALDIFLGLKPLPSLIAPQAHVSLSHLSPQIFNQSLQVCEELRVREEERVLDSHVVEVLIQVVGVVVAEEALVGRDGVVLPLITVHLLHIHLFIFLLF